MKSPRIPEFEYNTNSNTNNYGNMNVNHNNSNFLSQNSIISNNDKINNSIVNFKDEALHNPQKFGLSSYLSDIKPINNFTSTISESTKFSFISNNNFHKLSNSGN